MDGRIRSALEEQTARGLGLLALVFLVQPVAGGLSLLVAEGLSRAFGHAFRPANADDLLFVFPFLFGVGLLLGGFGRTRWAGRHGGRLVAVALLGLSAFLGYVEGPYRQDGGPSILPFVVLFLVNLIPFRPPVATALAALAGSIYVAWVTWAPLAHPLDPAERAAVVHGSLPFTLMVVVTAFVVSRWLFARRLAAIAAAHDRDAFARRIEEQARRLAETNRELVEAQNELVRRRHLAVLGNLVAGVSHELNNPAGALASASDVMGRAIERLEGGRGGAEQQGRALSALSSAHAGAKEAVDRIAKVVRRLRTFARLDQAEQQRADVNECMRVAAEVLGAGRLTLRYDLEEGPPLLCQPAALNEVFRDLLLNASEATAGNGVVTLRSRFGTGEARFTVEDDGPGVPLAIRDRIFEPGFTTKGQGVGTGLGLSTSMRIVEEQGGRLEMTSEPGRGASFTVVLPRPDPLEAPPPP